MALAGRRVWAGARAQASSAPATTAAPPAVPATYRRLVARRCGAGVRDVAEAERVAPPAALGEDDVLVRVTHAGVNGGCETFRARGEHWFARNRAAAGGFPLGAEGAGVVAAAGAQVAGPLAVPGTAVTFVGGAFGEYAVAPAATCWALAGPPSAEAAAVTISGVTACVALDATARVRAGETVLVTAAAGATGSFAVQLAKRAGCHVVATCGGAAKAAALLELGADRIIDHTREDVAQVLAAEYPRGVDVAYEGVGGPMLSAAMANLAEGGRLLVVGYISEYPHVDGVDTAPPSFAESLFWGGGSLQVGSKLLRGNVWPGDRAAVLACKRKVFDLWEAGEISALVDTTREFVGVDAIPDAVDFMLTGKAIGKVVVSM